MKKSILLILFLFHLSVFAGVVTTTADSGAGSLRQAIIDANSGDTITFDSSIDGQTITLSTSIQLTNKTITIEGNPSSRMILSNNSSSEGFHFVVDGTSSLTLKNLEITSGYSYSGNSDKAGSITVTGILNIDNCLFYQNIGYTVGVIWGNNSTSQINISNSSFFDNNATNTGDGAGVIIAQGPITIKNSTFANNRGNAGALMIGTATTAVNKIESCTIVNNITYASDKGVVRLNNAPVKVKNTIFYNNKNNNGAGTDNAFNGEYGGAVITSYGYNFVPTSTATFTATTGDIYNDATNPNLVPIIENSGTVAYNLPIGSSLIDSGSCTAIDGTTILTDQRGYARPVGNGCDKGAIEFGATSSTIPKLTLKAHGGAVQFFHEGDIKVNSPVTTEVDNITYELWFNYSGNYVTNNHLLLQSANGKSNAFFGIDQLDRLFIYFSETNSNLLTPTINNLNNTWHHAAVVRNNGTWHMYLDGTEQTLSSNNGLNATPSTPDVNSTLYIGSSSNTIVDEVRVWNTVRTQSQIQTNMNQQLDGNESGLVAYYNFDERVGTVVKDISNHGNDGTIEGNVTRLNFLGDTLHFTGALDSFVKIPNGGHVPTQSQGLTIGAWSKITSPGVRYHELFRVNGTGIIYGLRYHTDTTNTDNLEFFINYTDSNQTSLWEGLTHTVGSSFLNKWHYSAVTFDDSMIKLYLDGVLVASKAISINLGGTMTLGEAVIGTNQSTNTDSANNLLGDVSEVSVFSRVLTQAEIQQLIASAPNTGDSSLVGYWSLNEGTGTTAKDYSVNQKDGNITGTTWTNTSPIIYGDTIYTDYGINTWEKLVVENNTSTPTFLYGDDTQILDFNTTTGSFLYSSTNGDNSLHFSETTNQLSLNVNVKSLTNVIDDGTSGIDTLIGTNADDIFIATEGNDTINGLEGNDTVVYHLPSTNYHIVRNSDGSYSITDSDFISTDILSNIEFLNFSDVQNVSISSFIPDITTGLIAHYNFEGNANDSSGNDYNGTYSSFGIGKFGQSASFNGSQYVSISSIGNALPSGGEARTVSAWVKPNSSGGYEDILSWGTNISNQRFSVMKFASANGVADAFGVAAGVAASDFIGNYSINTSGWQHLTAVYEANATNIKFYVNGVLVNTLTGDRAILQTASANPLYIGSNPGAGGEFFNGSLDEVRIYDRALSSDDVALLYTFNPILHDANGTSGDDLIAAPEYNTQIDGGSGIDTIILSGTKASYTVVKNSDGSLTITNGTRIYIVTNIEKISFSDVQNLAIDSLLPLPKLTLKAHGGAVQFDGTSGYILANNPTTQTDNITMEGWINFSGATGENQFIFMNGTPFSNGYGVFVNTDNQLRVALSNVTILNPNVTPTQNEWHHIALSRLNGIWKFYYDGVDKNMTNATYTDVAPTGSFTLGANSVGNEKFKGLVDEVRVWNIARTEAQIQSSINTQLDGNETGLLAYYNFDEKTGMSIKDISGNNHNGTIEGNITRLNFLGDGLQFGTLNSYVALNSNPDLNGTDSITTTAWIKTSDVSSNNTNIFSFSGAYAGELQHWVYISPTTRKLTLAVGLQSTGWSYTSADNTVVNDGVWHHVAAVKNSSDHTTQLYVDGNLVAVGTYLSSYDSATRNNSHISQLGENFNGNIAEFSLWNKALTQTEIKKLTVSSPNLNESSLIAYFPLNEGSGSYVEDYSINENGGEIIATTWVNTAPIIYGDTIYTATGINSIIKPVVLNSSNQNFELDGILPSISLFQYQFPILNRADGVDGAFDLYSYDLNGTEYFKTINLKHIGTFGIEALADGNNTIIGTLDIDTIVYDGNRSQYSIVKHIEGGTFPAPQMIRFTLIKPNGDIDTLQDIEYISFDDVQNVSLASLDSLTTTVTKTNSQYEKIVYSIDGTKLFLTADNSSSDIIYQMNSIDSNITATYNTQEYEKIKDMIVVGNYLLVSTSYTDYTNNSTTIKINTFNANDIATGPVATWSQTFSSGGQIEGKMAYANGKLALIGGYDKNMVWVLNATNPLLLTLKSLVELPAHYPTNLTMAKDGTSLAIASYNDAYLYSINGDANATYASTIGNLSDGRGIYPVIANGKLIVFVESFDGYNIVLNMKAYDISNLVSPTSIDFLNTYTGTMVNTALSADEKSLFVAYRDDSAGQESYQKLLTFNLTSGIPVLVDSKSDTLEQSLIYDIALSPVGQTIATTGDTLWIYNNSLYMVPNQVPTTYNDFIQVPEINATIDGLSGIDTVILNSTKVSYTITKNTISNFTIIGNGHSYILNNVEIVSFSDGQNTLLSSMNNAPILTTISNPTARNEDFSDFNITLSSSDTENDSVRYSAKSNNTDKVTVLVTGNVVTIRSIGNAYGTVSIDVNVTQENNSSLYDTQTILFTINPVNDAPIVTITTSKVAAFTYEMITLNATATDVENDMVTYLWNFGDGTTSTERNVTKFYSSIGTYTVSCTVSDGNGTVDVKNVTIIVSEATSLSVDKEKLLFSVGGGSQNITVTQSNQEEIFTVTTDNSSIIQTAKSGNIVTVTPLKIGKTFITINDGKTSKVVKVTVSELTRDNTTGVVTDTISGLQWQDDESVITTNVTFTGAQSYCSTLTLGGFEDWRLASVDEIMTLIDYDKYNHVLNASIENSSSSNYWSGDEYRYNTNLAWVVSTLSGNIGTVAKTVTNKVRCVRGGDFKTFDTLSGLKNAGLDRNTTTNIVTDSKNNLQWQDDSAVGTIKQTVQGAKSYCEGLVLNGDGWRLPTIYELSTIVNFKGEQGVFVNNPIGYIWSATKLANYSNYVWYVDQNNGNINYNNSYYLSSVRCVRGEDTNATYSNLLYKNTPVIANAAPIVSISQSKTTATINETINFSATVTDTNNTIFYSWSFGDGTTSTEQNPIKSYANFGTYSVSCVVVSGDYNISKSFDVTITNAPIEYKYLSFNAGWSLVSLPVTLELNATQIGDRFSTATSIWKYANNNWQVYPQIANIAPITTLKEGEGFWISAINSNKLQFEGITSTILTSSSLPSTLANGWYLLGTGTSVTPTQLLQRNNKIYSIWKYKNNKWKASSVNTTFTQQLLDNHIETIESIDGGEGFWINIQN